MKSILLANTLLLVPGALCLLTFAARPAPANVRLPAVIGDGMVFQRDMNVPIWGFADPGEQVTVAFAGQKATATADTKGNWKVLLKPIPAGGPYEMTVTGNNILTVSDVLVGEVWLGSGQSNMAMRVRECKDADKEIAAADLPQIRMFKVPGTPSTVPLNDIKSRWVVSSPKTAGSFSAAAFFFGRQLHQELKVPIGLIDSSVGGTPAEAWTSRPALLSLPEFADAVQSWDKAAADYPQAKTRYDAKLADWQARADKAKAEGQPSPTKPQPPREPLNPNRPAVLYNGMIAPVIPYGIKGVIWYQGEANTDPVGATRYRQLLSLLITDWRTAWHQGDFPFLIVQLANFQKTEPQPSNSGWARLREAQLKVSQTVPNTGLAVAIDTGEAGDIHPKNKQEVGRRLALVALAKTYGKDIVYSGPIYDAMKIEGNSIRLTFKQLGGGLVSRDNEPLKGFAVAGPDKKFVWADAKIGNNSVVVTSPDVPNPVAVRYAWAINPLCNFYNKEALPASPFRTDDW